MGDMGEINAVGLSRIDEPGDLFPGGHIFSVKLLLLRFFSEREFRIIVAHHAGFQLGDAHESAVLSKAVAVKASLQFRLPLKIPLFKSAQVSLIGISTI